MIQAGRTFSKLVANVDRAYDVMKQFRTRRTEAIKRIVGTNYSDNGSDTERPVNMLDLIISARTRELAPRSPRVMVTTKVRNLRPWAEDFRINMDHSLAEMKFGQTLRQCAREALISPLGVMKIGIAPTSMDMDADGFLHDAGQVFADNVTLDNWVHDMKASRWDQVSFMGDYYLLPYEYVMQSNLFSMEARGKLRPTNSYDRDNGERQAADISKPERSGWETDDYIPMIRLVDVYCPHFNTIFTWADGQQGTIPLRETPFDGPSGGPYIKLVLEDVPDNTMGLPMVANLRDLDGLNNRLIAQMKKDAEGKKRIIGFQAGHADDALRIQNAAHNSYVRMDNPQAAREFEVGGVDRMVMALSMQVREMISYLAGNIEATEGLDSQSGTLGQDQLLAAAASKRSKDYKETMFEFTQEAVNRIAWYEWTEPLRERQIERPIPGTDVVVHSLWSPETREGDWLDYNVSIVPYSMEYRSPQQQLQAVNSVVQGIIAPFAQQLAQQGGTVDVRALTKKVMQLAGVEDDMQDIFVWVGQDLDPGSPERGQQPVQVDVPVKRQYERISTNGNPDQSKQRMMASLMSDDGPGKLGEM